MRPKISLFLSAVRPHLWEGFLKSLESNVIPYEVIFCGDERPDFKLPSVAKYIYSKETSGICYGIASKACTGELIHWTADDAEYSENALDLVYDFYHSFNNSKLVVSMQTIENGHICKMDTARFFGGKRIGIPNDTPIMAPLGFMNRKYFEKLGGYDFRYKYCQAENDVVMRVLADGGKVEMFLHSATVSLHHALKHGGQGDHKEQRHITIAQHVEDRAKIEETWMRNGEVMLDRTNKFIPYPEEIYAKTTRTNR